MSIYGNMVGCGSGFGKTVIIEDADGNSFTGVVVDQEVIFTATDNDVREGAVYASDNGISTGTKVIPSYHTTQGWRVVPNNSQFVIPVQQWDYTELQLIVCGFNTNLQDSVSAEKVGINNSIYDVLSTTKVSAIIKDESHGTVNLGITNTSGQPSIIRYLMYKEIY